MITHFTRTPYPFKVRDIFHFFIDTSIRFHLLLCRVHSFVAPKRGFLVQWWTGTCTTQKLLGLTSRLLALCQRDVDGLLGLMKLRIRVSLKIHVQNRHCDHACFLCLIVRQLSSVWMYPGLSIQSFENERIAPILHLSLAICEGQAKDLDQQTFCPEHFHNFLRIIRKFMLVNNQKQMFHLAGANTEVAWRLTHPAIFNWSDIISALVLLQ